MLNLTYFYIPKPQKLIIVKINTKTRYGLRAMLEIGLDDTNNGVFQKDIAKNQNISIKYLDHIINGLKVAGLISNLRGKKSGYVLTRPAEEITIYDIHNAFEPGICVVDCLQGHIDCEKEGSCAAKGFWSGLNDILIEYFQKTTLSEMIDNQNKLGELISDK